MVVSMLSEQLKPLLGRDRVPLCLVLVIIRDELRCRRRSPYQEQFTGIICGCFTFITKPPALLFAGEHYVPLCGLGSFKQM